MKIYLYAPICASLQATNLVFADTYIHAGKMIAAKDLLVDLSGATLMRFNYLAACGTTLFHPDR